jgi:branched-chain amino acid transport system ATP-binding protein
MSGELLAIRDLSAGYGGVRVLSGISLDVPEGTVVALIGANGAGKSTTLRAISGQIRRTAGAIEFDGKPIHGLPANAIVARGIAHVPEGRRIFPELTVEENLLAGAFLVRKRRDVARLMDEVMATFPRLRERRSQSGSTLSGGEQQMLAFARALMCEPRMLLLDEPSLGLAPQIAAEIGRQVDNFRARGLTVLLVEQNAKMALNLADYAYVLDLGHIVREGTGRELLNDVDVQRAYLGAAVEEMPETPPSTRAEGS